MLTRISIFCAATICLVAPARSDEALIAVATNFAGIAEQLETRFESTSEHRITLTTGSTGKLYAQIRNGAPFDALLAADRERPRLLESSEFGVEESRFTYAIGRLALASRDATLNGLDLRANFKHTNVRTVAIANPELAPYGIASREVLQSLRQWKINQYKIVMGENVGQAYAMLATGNASLGIVALSLVLNQKNSHAINFVEVPEGLHGPIRQDALLLAHGKENAAARAFLTFLRDDDAQSLLTNNGYGVD